MTEQFNRTYLIFIAEAHLCHVYCEVMLVWHDDFYFFNLQHIKVLWIHKITVMIWTWCAWCTNHWDSIQDHNLSFIKGLLHRRWKLSTIKGASKLFNYCVPNRLPKRSIPDSIYYMKIKMIITENLPCIVKVNTLNFVVAPPRIDWGAETPILGVLQGRETVP